MALEHPSLLATENGIVTKVGQPIPHPELKILSLPISMKVRLRGTQEKDHVREMLRAEGDIELFLNGRSSIGQLGYEVESDRSAEPEFSNGSINVPALFTPLSQNARSHSLDEVRKALLEQKVARLCFAVRSAALNEAQLYDAWSEGKIDPAEDAMIIGDTIECSLEHAHFRFDRESGMDNPLREVFQHGRLALRRILAKESYRPSVIEARDVLVGSIRFATNQYHVLLNRETNHPKTFHLSPRLLDADYAGPRDGSSYQVELANSSGREVPTKDLTVGLKLYPAS